MSQPTILWDFDGTLVNSLGWGNTLLKVLTENYPSHGVKIEQIRAFLQTDFPWHQPEKPHHNLSNPELWWKLIESILARAFEGVGYDKNESGRMAKLAHYRLLDLNCYTLYADSLPTLERLERRGWRHIILSNSFPELPSIVRQLPINKLISNCITSGIVGYEKPNRKIFDIALYLAGNPSKIWMVGDSLSADVRGAEAIGISAIMVRGSAKEQVKFYAPDLYEAAKIIEQNS